MSERQALVLLDHGSRREGADRYLVALVEALRVRRPELRVALAHLEIVPPSLDEALARCGDEGVDRVSVYPLFLAAGRHLERDVPEQIARARVRHPQLRIELLEPLGARPELADLLLASYEHQAGRGSAPQIPGGPERPDR